MLDKNEIKLLEMIESNFDIIDTLDHDTLIAIVKAQKKADDESKNIQRSPQGEQIIQDDEVVVDDEEYL